MRHRAVVPYVFAVTLGLTAAATAHSAPRGEAKVTLAGKPIVIDYGRPSLKGRDMLGKAEVGQDWRMGADAPTTLDTPVSLSFGAARVPPGQYVLRARKASAKDWVLKLERDGKTAAEVPLESLVLDKSVEEFTIDLAEEKGQGVFRMSWGTVALTTRFTAK
jgi:DUF2911 family protein